MDEYRRQLKGSGVVPILWIMESLENGDGVFRDEQIVRVAGIVEKVRMKTTRSNSMMAYVTLEDDTASIELLAFSNVIARSGSYLKENMAIVAEGRISVRDEKAPQMVLNEARPLSEVAEAAPAAQAQKLYLKLPAENGAEDRKTRAILNMFPGDLPAVLYFADSGVRRGTRCMLRADMLAELRALLGEKNVVLK